MWVQIDGTAIKRLDDLQNSMFKKLFAVPHSVPTPSLPSELGCLSMEERIDQRKLNLLFHLKNLETSSLANGIYNLQREYNFPGLVEECKVLLSMFNLQNIIDEESRISKLQWKSIVN